MTSLNAVLSAKVVDQVEDAVIPQLQQGNQSSNQVDFGILNRVIPVDQSTVTMNRMVEKADAT